MKASIPFQEGLVLGCSLDVTKQPFKNGPLHVPDDIKVTDFQINSTSAFAVIHSITDVCNIFQYSPAYVLKVEANLLQDHVLTSCLRDIGNKDKISVIFRLSFLQGKKYLLSGVQLNRDVLHSAQDKSQKQDNSGSASRGSESNGSAFSATHWVKTLEFGNELIVICKISSPDSKHMSSTFRKLRESLGGLQGSLEPNQIHGLEEFAKSMDKKLKKQDYKNMCTSIEYGTFSELQLYPANFTDMVNVMKEFLFKCEKWKDVYRKTGPSTLSKRLMTWNKGSYQPKEPGLLDRFPKKPDAPKFFRNAHISSESDSRNGGSIQANGAESDDIFYHLRAILQHLDDEDMSHSFVEIEYPESHQRKFQDFHKIFIKTVKAIEKLRRFLAPDNVISENVMKEGNDLLKTFLDKNANLIDAIGRLDLISVPDDEEMRSHSSLDISRITKDFIENVTSKLPPGPNLDLLLIGKTGHGKSSTGNTILRQNLFEASASGDSVTSTCGVGWSRIDGRIIKVVDTPGVCDTRYDSESSDTDTALHGISDAIVHCSEGFHALLLVLQYGTRMTPDEKKAIGMLKCLLGKDVIKDHCICVITHGDDFRSDHKGKITFMDWCKSENGFLKNSIFKECQYRCVLFDNKSEDRKCLNRQLIELISNVDGLSLKGTRYTNALFEFAVKARKQCIEEENAPEVDENVTRDIQLILSDLEKMVEGSEEVKSFESDLKNLRSTVDNLNDKVNGVENGNMNALVETVLRLSQIIHSKMDEDKEIAKRQELTQEANDQKPKSSKEKFSTELNNTKTILKDAQKVINKKSKTINTKVTNHVATEVKDNYGCFPGVSWVITKDGSRRSMSDLDVGDEILVRNRKGKFVYEKVYMFGHRDVEEVGQFLVLETKQQRVTVTHDHIVYCIKNGLEASPPARLIREGDELITFSCDGLEKQPVLRISLEKQRGLYAPFTKSGSLIVDGALMSCYVDVVSPATAHKLLSPVRKLYQISPSALNFVNGYNRGQVIPTWAKLILKFKTRSQSIEK